MFKIATPITYWLLIGLWSFIFAFSLRRILQGKTTSALYNIILLILLIESCRTLFESVYFGLWYTAKMGLLPNVLEELLVVPAYVFIPKAANVLGGVAIVLLVIYRWRPAENRFLAEQKILVGKLQERLQVEQEVGMKVRENEALLKTVLNASNDGMIAVDWQGRIMVFNTAAENMFGYDRDEVLGQMPDLLVPPEVRPRYKSAVLEFLEKGRLDAYPGNSIEHGAQKKDGTRFLVEMSLSREYHGDEYFALAVVRDITERKKAEEEVQKHTEEVESFNRVLVERELRCVELKEEVNELCTEIGRVPKYIVVSQETESGQGDAER